MIDKDDIRGNEINMKSRFGFMNIADKIWLIVVVFTR